MASPSVEGDDENFAEDECTIEFGEEEPPSPPAAPTSNGYPGVGVVGGPRFIEYPGEDFSQYLSETTMPTPDYDNDQDQALPSIVGGRRRYVKNTNNAKATLGRSHLHRPASTGAAAPPPPSVDNTYMIPDDGMEEVSFPLVGPSMIPPPASPTSSRRSNNKLTVRERVGRLLSRGQHGGQQQQQRTRSQSADRLHVANFTFADSKIGTMMLAQREREQASQAGGFSDDAPPETQSDLGVVGSSRTWWDVGTLSSNSTVRARDHGGGNGSAKSPDDRRRTSTGDVSSSVPDLSDDQGQDRPSLIGSLSRAMHAKARSRRGSDASLPSPPASSAAATPSDQPPSGKSTPPGSSSNFILRAKDKPAPDARADGEGKASKRGGTLFRRLKDGVGSRTGSGQTPTSRRNSEGTLEKTSAVSAPRYTRIYDEMNRLTADFRQSTVDNPLP